MKHLQVAVLRGGPSEEHLVSMKSGSAVINSLIRKGFNVKDVTISKQGEWLCEGRVKDPLCALSAADVVFVALHGQYGEDGEVQKTLQRLGLPFTGSNSLSAGIAFNKYLTKETLREYGVLMPRHTLINRTAFHNINAVVREIGRQYQQGIVVKPTTSGSSFGVKIMQDQTGLQEVLTDLLREYPQVLVEEYISGIETTCGVLENYRNSDLYVLPVIEIIPPAGAEFFDYDSKYSGKASEICPARISGAEREEISRLSTLIHKALHLSQYSRSDFIIDKGKIYFLEVNTHPGLTSESLYPKAADAIGLHFDDLVEHLVLGAKC